MADTDVSVTFGANVSGLTAGMDQVKSQLSAFANATKSNFDQAKKAIDPMAAAMSASKIAATNMIGGLSAAGSAARSQSEGLSAVGAALKKYQEEQEATVSSNHKSGVSFREYVFEIHALADEISSGRLHQAFGTASKLLGDMAIHGQAATVGMIVGFGALAVVVASLAKYQEDAAISAGHLEAAELAVGKATDFTVSYEQITQLATQLDISRSSAEELLATFARMPDTTNTTAQQFAVMAAAISDHLKSIGEDGKKAGDLLAAAIENPTKGMPALLNAMKLLTPEMRNQIAETSSLHTANGMLQFGLQELATGLHADSAALQDTRDHMSGLASAESGLGNAFEGLKSVFGATDDSLRALQRRLDEAGMALGTLAGNAHVAEVAMNGLNRALGEANAAVPAFEKIRSMAGAISDVQKGISEAVGSGKFELAAQLRLQANQMTDELTRMQQQVQGPLGDPMRQLRENIDKIETAPGIAKLDRLKQELAVIQVQMAQPATREQGLDLGDQEAAKQREIRDEGYHNFILTEDAKAASSRRGAAERVAILQGELTQAVAIYGKGSDQELEIERKLNTQKEIGARMGAASAKKEAADVLAEAQKAAEGQIQAAARAQDLLKAQLDLQVAQHKISQGQEDTQLEAGLDKQYQLQLAELQKELALQGLKPQQIQEINNKIEALEDQHQIKMLQLQKKTLDDNEKAWQTYATTIEGEFNGQLRSLLSGQETWGQAMKNILGDLVIKAIEDFEKMAAQWAVSQLSMTAAATAGATAQGAAQASGATAGLLPTLAADAAKVFGNVFAFLSPVMGPAAAGPALAAQASVMAVPALDVGGYVLRDGMAMIHAGETVTPASVASPYSGGSSQGGGNTQNHFSMGGITNHNYSQAPDSAALMRQMHAAVRKSGIFAGNQSRRLSGA